MHRLALLAVALVFVTGGCMGGDGDGAAYEVGDLERMVLLADDLEGRGWTRFDWGKQAQADQPAGARSNPARFDRLGGWKGRYRRPGSRQTAGPLVIESRADVFENPDGARDDFDAYGGELEQSGTQIEEVPELGERGVVATLVQGDVRFFLVMWRDENAIAALNLNGFDGKLTRKQVLALARKQDERMRAVAS